MSRMGLGVAVVVALLGLARDARAEDVPTKQAEARWLFSVSGGAGLLAPSGPQDARYAMAFGLHVGSRFPTGISVTLGYDNLELHPDGTQGTPWQLIDMSARYTLKYGPLKPFGEVVGGLSFVSTSEPLDPGNGPLEVDLAAGLGAGVTLPVGNTFAMDLAVRGYTAPALGRVLQAALVQLTVELDLDLQHND